MCRLGKASLTAPLYICFSWGLIITYQLFTQAAVYSFIQFINGLSPSVGEFLIPNIDVLAFIHAFAWIFVLSSVIPSIILGKGRSVLLQFLLCLAVTLMAVSIEHLLTFLFGTAASTQLQALIPWFQNPLIAAVYLSAPYLLMLYLDIHTRKKIKETEKPRDIETVLEESTPSEQQAESGRDAGAQEESGEPLLSRSKGSSGFLYGAGVVCFALALATLRFGDAILPKTVVSLSTLLYVAIFASLGLILTVLGRYTASLVKQEGSI